MLLLLRCCRMMSGAATVRLSKEPLQPGRLPVYVGDQDEDDEKHHEDEDDPDHGPGALLVVREVQYGGCVLARAREEVLVAVLVLVLLLAADQEVEHVLAWAGGAEDGSYVFGGDVVVLCWCLLMLMVLAVEQVRHGTAEHPAGEQGSHYEVHCSFCCSSSGSGSHTLEQMSKILKRESR